jgi:signal transduction histidine kinase
MRKRIEGIGGECQVESTPGKGTTVRFIIRVEN